MSFRSTSRNLMLFFIFVHQTCAKIKSRQIWLQKSRNSTEPSTRRWNTVQPLAGVASISHLTSIAPCSSGSIVYTPVVVFLDLYNSSQRFAIETNKQFFLCYQGRR